MRHAWKAILLLLATTGGTGGVVAEDLGQLSVNPYAPNSTSNSYSEAGSEYSSKSVRNPYSPYGSP